MSVISSGLEVRVAALLLAGKPIRNLYIPFPPSLAVAELFL